MNICLVSMNIAWKNTQENLSKMEEHIQHAKTIDPTIDTIVFPELGCVGYILDETLAEYCEDLNGYCVETTKELAKKYGVHIISGFLEKNGELPPYNTSFVVNKQGALVAQYRKNHLFSQSEEINLYSRGEEVIVFELDEWKCSIAICMDIRYPRLFETVVNAGAELIFIPANWTKGINKFEMLKIYTQARAGENQIYCASIDRTGKDEYFEYTGSWMLSDPLGIDISTTHEEIYHIGTIKKERIEEVRNKLPLKSSYREQYSCRE